METFQDTSPSDRQGTSIDFPERLPAMVDLDKSFQPLLRVRSFDSAYRPTGPMDSPTSELKAQRNHDYCHVKRLLLSEESSKLLSLGLAVMSQAVSPKT